MNPVDYAILARRAYTDSPTVGKADSASRMHVYGDVHVFRGSDDVDSWLHDFDIALVPVPGLGHIHAGFYSAWLDICKECLALPAPKAIAGHSLGAALAIICAAEWALKGVIVPVYAFEPPRLCADNTLMGLLKSLGIPWFACRNGNDLVTQIPIGLALPGPLTRIGKPSLPIENVEDHSIDRVIEALAA
jgi:triacylglycerol lipase